MANELGVWTVSLSLPPGRHEYAFIVSGPQGEQWLPDPSAPTLRDEFGTVSSIVMVDDTRAKRVLGSES
jgi:1,4-alpha-glucan branching enzyme